MAKITWINDGKKFAVEGDNESILQVFEAIKFFDGNRTVNMEAGDGRKTKEGMAQKASPKSQGKVETKKG